MNKNEEIQITELKYPFNVQTRPGMYIGELDTANTILREVVDNSIDELYNSEADKIYISTNIGDQGWNIVEDNGRGMPITMSADEPEVTQAEIATSRINAGSKFNKQSTVAIGLNGVGIKATNALSDRFLILSKITDQNYDKSIPDVENYWNQAKEDGYYVIEYAKGIKVYESAIAKSDILNRYGFYIHEGMSTITAFIPTPEIFDDPSCTVNKKNLAYINLIMDKFYNKKVDIEINGKSVDDTIKPYQFEFLQEVKSSKTDEVARFYVTFECDANLGVNDQAGSVNSLIVNRGRHMDYVTNQYCEALKDYFTMSHGHLMNGLRIMVIVLAGEVDFSSQTKERLTKLCNIGWGDINPLYQAFRKIFKNNQEYFSAHVARLNEYAESLMNISTLELIKQQLGGELGNTKRSKSKVPDNVADALSTNRKECELFIIEGDSAGTQLKAARNNKIHALLKLRGVPLNAINLDINTMLENEEMKSIVLAINCGVEEWHDTSDPRYGKIIIAADADVDGLRIASLVSGIIAKKMPFLIREGMVYIVETPIYQQDGKYIYPSDDVDKLLDRRRPFRRFKGLGELSTQDAKYTMLDPETRRLKQLTMEGAIEALEILTSTSARKELIINSGTLIDPYNLGIYA